MDTNVVSVLSRPHLAPPALINWLDEKTDMLYLSAVTIAELVSGVAKVRRAGAGSKADQLAQWIDLVLLAYGERVLACDVAAARIAGALIDRGRAAGRVSSFADILIAATAQSRGFTVLTRNLKHFAPLGVAAHDPFASLPGVQA